MSFVMFPPLIRFRASATKISTSDQRRAQMQYVDGFVLPIPKKNLQGYRRIAQKAGTIWREHGALDYRECVADDVKVSKLTSFPRSVKLKGGETVVSRNMMDPKAMPFDAKRMIYG